MSGAAPTREVAYRVFADEFAESTYSYAESDDERAPQYLVTPTGARINRIFVVGVLTETEEVSDGVLRARIVDPTGAFVLYAGQYQPEALAFFERADPPVFVSLTGKARTFEPDGADRVFTSLRPERVNEVDAETRDSWVVQTALHTLERTGLLAQALDLEARDEDLSVRLTAAGVESGLAAGIPRAIREYEPTTGYLEALQQMALDAVRVVAGEIDEVSGIGGTPSEGGDGEVLTGFTDVSLAANAGESTEGASAVREEPEADGESESESEPEPESDQAIEPETEVEPEPESEESNESTAADADEDGESPAVSENEEGDVEIPDEPEESDELYELSDEERAEVEENFDVGFESGAEIGGPEETEDIEPETGDAETEEPDQETGETEEPDPEIEGEADTESTAEEEAETDSPDQTESPAEDADAGDLSEADRQDLVVDTLNELGDGAGVPRTELIETLQERHELDEDEIEDAIEAALLGGRCFESGSEDLKPI